MNIVMLIGNVGKEPEIHTTGGGSQVARFGLATTERWKDGEGERREKTTWHDCVVWGSLVQIVEKYVTRGKKIAVVGRIEKRKWQGQDGKDRWAVEVNVDRLELLSPAEKRDRDDDLDDLDDEEPERRRRSTGKKRQQESSLDDELDDSIPF